MGIPIGKLALYTLGRASTPPAACPSRWTWAPTTRRCWMTPCTWGSPTGAFCGKEYDDFIDKFVAGVKRHFPTPCLQWEDFSKSNAFNNLARHQQALPSFNDDIQGTGAVVLAGIIGAVKSKGKPWASSTTWSTGPGPAGSGWRIRSARG